MMTMSKFELYTGEQLPAWAKNTLASFRISLARRSSLFSRSVP